MSQPRRIRAMIVDDEPLGREAVRALLSADEGIELVGEASDGLQAIADIQALRPELVFLDIQMPECDGFAVLEALPEESLPVVVFVTAYDKYALDAFAVHALDYLLKPIDPARFRAALERVKGAIGKGTGEAASVNEQLRRFVAELHERSRYRERIVVKAHGKLLLFKVDEIDWIESAGDYVNLRVRGEQHLLRETMTQVEQKLDPARFLRIHRSTIVNVDRVKELELLFQGQYLVRLKDGSRLTASRSYKKQIDQLLSRSL
jgi:two-component system LytT family response regulator